MNQPFISVIVFALNESASLAFTVAELETALADIDYELVIVNDGSDDGQDGVMARLEQANERIRTIHHAGNLGLGPVYRTGFREARGRFLTFFPGDGQFPGSIAADFCRIAEDYDLVLGFVPPRDITWLTRLVAWTERTLYGFLVGRLPRFNGVFLLRREVLAKIPPLRTQGRGWIIVFEMILRVTRAGFRHTTIETDYRPRLHGHSKVRNLRSVLANLKQMWQLRKILQ